MSWPTDCKFNPSWATFSRSMTISASGWSTFTSMSGGKANIPLLAAFSCSCFAKLRISAESAVDAMTNSTGKFPPPGRAEGRMGKVWIPGMVLTFRCTSGRICADDRVRSFQGFSPIPQKPPDGKVIWNVNLVSGMAITVRFTSRVERATWSRVELDGVLTMPKMTPWSSTGASSRGDCRNMATARTEIRPQAV